MEELNKLIQAQFNKMCATNNLFRVKLDGKEIWNLYLKSFTSENDPVFRDPTSSVHNCNHCNNFIRRYGNVVAIDENYNIISIFDVIADEEYAASISAIAQAIKSSIIGEVFFETFAELNSLPYESCNKKAETFKLGIAKNFKRYNAEEVAKYGKVDESTQYEFNHFNLVLPSRFVDMSGKSVESIMAFHRDNKEVFERAMLEIPLDTLHLVKDLIVQGSLLNGDAYLSKVNTFITLKQEYNTISVEARTNWCWKISHNLPIAKFKNELIGVLCSELAEGKELNAACLAWNKRVDPANYMKAVAPITKTQIKEAETFVTNNGYTESFDRRLATIDDIKATEIKHINADNAQIKSVALFDGVKAVSTQHKRSEFDGIEEVSIDKFMNDILPSCTNVEVYLKGEHEGNMVTLTTAKNPNSKPIFKWDSNYSWTFNGNLAGKSMIKENVKAAGGKITGILRSSLQWNDEDTPGIIDFDLHCKTPFYDIYYGHKRDHDSQGWLDVDMICPSTIGIENITWQNTLKDGTYKFFVQNFSGHTRHNGFKMEIEFDGNVFNYRHSSSFTGNVNVATVTVKKGVMEIEHHLTELSGNTSKEIYGINTNQFHKVNLICTSPNHWHPNEVGNKHYLFMLENCKIDRPIRSFHNENLNGDLQAHRKVMDTLANTTMLQPADKQLSGLGFNATVRDELIIKLSGTHKRMIKVKF